MKLHFLKFNPTENMTLLVTDPVPRALQGPLAARLMENRSVGAEQVGYLEKASLPGARARLQMMGGEFCGNASMCMAVFLTRNELPPEGEKTVEIEVSGAGRVKCALRREGPDFRCRVEMPLPREIRRVGELTLVRLPGIAHFVSQYPVESAGGNPAKIGPGAGGGRGGADAIPAGKGTYAAGVCEGHGYHGVGTGLRQRFRRRGRDAGQ